MITRLTPENYYYAASPCGIAPQITSQGPIGVTITSASYDHLVNDAVRRFQRFTGLDVIVLPTTTEPGFAAKLNLDLLCPARPIVFFDVDLWILRPYDFRPLAESGQFCAVPDPGAWNPKAFPHTDSTREGWDKSTYFNSGLFTCDLSDPKIRQVFEQARLHLQACHQGSAQRPVDWTDQYFLNAAVQRQPGLLRCLPFALNFYLPAVRWGSFPHIPREIVGLHAAGYPCDKKLETLRIQEQVFGGAWDSMHPEAVEYFSSKGLLND